MRHSVSLDLAHILKTDKKVWKSPPSEYDPSYRFEESSLTTTFTPFSQRIYANEATLGGNFNQTIVCSVCKESIKLVVNQQRMLVIAASDLKKNPAFTEKLIKSLRRSGRGGLLLAITLFVIGLYSSYYTDLSFIHAATAVLGFAFVSFLIFASDDIQRGILSELRSPRRDLLVSPKELQRLKLTTPKFAQEASFVRSITLSLLDNDGDHTFRHDPVGRTEYESGNTTYRTENTGADLTQLTARFFHETDKEFLQLGGRDGVSRPSWGSDEIPNLENYEKQDVINFTEKGIRPVGYSITLVFNSALWAFLISLPLTILGAFFPTAGHDYRVHRTGLVSAFVVEYINDDFFQLWVVLFIGACIPAFFWKLSKYWSSLNKGVAYPILWLGIAVSCVYWWFDVPFINVTNLDDALWATFYALVWPALNIVVGSTIRLLLEGNSR